MNDNFVVLLLLQFVLVVVVVEICSLSSGREMFPAWLTKESIMNHERDLLLGKELLKDAVECDTEKEEGKEHPAEASFTNSVMNGEYFLDVWRERFLDDYAVIWCFCSDECNPWKRCAWSSLQC
jgi:hypothetical protein